MAPYAITIATVLLSGVPLVLLLRYEIATSLRQAKRSRYKAYVRTTHYWGEPDSPLRHCMFCRVTQSALEHRMKSDVEALGSLRCMSLERA